MRESFTLSTMERQRRRRRNKKERKKKKEEEVFRCYFSSSSSSFSFPLSLSGWHSVANQKNAKASFFPPAVEEWLWSGLWLVSGGMKISPSWSSSSSSACVKTFGVGRNEIDQRLLLFSSNNAIDVSFSTHCVFVSRCEIDPSFLNQRCSWVTSEN